MKKNNTLTTVLLLTMAVTIFVVSIIKENNKKSETDNAISQIQAIVSPYQNKDSMKKVDIITQFSNSSESNRPTKKANKVLSVSGTIKDGYLYVRASVDAGKPLTQYDSVFITLQNGASILGGHLIETQSLDTPNNKVATEFLYKLSDVKYKKTYTSDDLEIQSGNWLELLNTVGQKQVMAFSSTARTGVLEDVAIYYDCIDGQECSVVTQ